MSDVREMSVSEARESFSDAVNRAAFGSEITYVTRGRRRERSAAIVPASLIDEYESLLDFRDGVIAEQRLQDMRSGAVKAIPASEVFGEPAE